MMTFLGLFTSAATLSPSSSRKERSESPPPEVSQYDTLTIRSEEYEGTQLNATQLELSEEELSDDEINEIAEEFKQLLPEEEDSSDGKVLIRIDLLAKLNKYAEKGRNSPSRKEVPLITLQRLLDQAVQAVEPGDTPVTVSVTLEDFNLLRGLAAKVAKRNRTPAKRRLQFDQVESPQTSPKVETKIGKGQWMKIAIAANAIVVAFFFIFSCFYCSGTFTFDVFAGRVGVAITICGTLLLTLLAGSTFCLGFRHVERIK